MRKELMEKDPELATLRRERTMLGILGLSLIAFGAWSLIKSGFYFAMEAARRGTSLETADGSEESLAAVAVAVAVPLVLDLLFRLYVGLSAGMESMGKKRGKLYLAAALAMVVAEVVTLVLYIIGIFREFHWSQIPDNLVSLIVELTSITLLIKLVRTALRVKKLTNE